MKEAMMVFSVFVFIFFSSCSHLEQIDRSLVFQESMGFDGVLESKRTYPLSQLGSDQGAQSQGCTVCAK